MFEKLLQEAVDNYNNEGLQWCEAGWHQTSCDEEQNPPNKNFERVKFLKILDLWSWYCVCQFMRRAHEHMQQCHDVVFMDATPSFKTGTVGMLLSVMPAGAVSLGIIVRSD